MFLVVATLQAKKIIYSLKEQLREMHADRIINRSAAFLIAPLISLTLILSGCGGSVSGGEQTILNSGTDVSGVTFQVNNRFGSDAANGTDEPFQSLQYALNQLRPGDRLIVQDSGQPYNVSDIVDEAFDANGDLLKTLRGFKLTTSGTEALPIIIEGESTGRPIIDQQQSSSLSGDATLGLLLDCVNHIVIRNFEIRNVNEAGISSSIKGACETTNITIEGNHIHHVYGEKYVGGIRMMGVSNLLIRDNHLHDIFSSQSDEDKVLVTNGRGLTNILIENNQFDALEVGVAINAQGLGSSTFAFDRQETVSGIQLSNNVFNNIGSSINLHTTISDAASSDKIITGLFSDIDIYGNVFDQIDSALALDTGNSLYPSNNICVFNNTIINTLSSSLTLTGVRDMEIFNNIFSMPQSALLTTNTATANTSPNSLAYVDNNLFWNYSSLSWRLGNDSPEDTIYSDLASWNMASSHPELQANPDLNTVLADPQFIDPANADYRLSQASPAFSTGRFGLSIGADYNFSEDANLIINACIQRVF